MTYLSHIVGGTAAIRHSTLLPRDSRTRVPRSWIRASRRVACPPVVLVSRLLFVRPRIRNKPIFSALDRDSANLRRPTIANDATPRTRDDALDVGVVDDNVIDRRRAEASLSVVVSRRSNGRKSRRGKGFGDGRWNHHRNTLANVRGSERGKGKSHPRIETRYCIYVARLLRTEYIASRWLSGSPPRIFSLTFSPSVSVSKYRVMSENISSWRQR